MMSSLPLKRAFALAWPASLAAMISPLLGMIDNMVLTRAGSTADIAGVALAGAVFSILYWSLGFLRMGVAGLVAQADGRDDEALLRAHLIQGVALGAIVGTLLLLFRPVIIDAASILMADDQATSPEALSAMGQYISIRLWAAPPTIAFFACIGWLTGQGRTGLMMVVLVLMTGINAALDIYLVLVHDMGVTGIAIGTAIAEATGALLAGGAVLHVLHKRGGIRIAWIKERLSENLKGVLALNLNIFIRTFCLALVFAYFVRAGSQFGDVTIAANQLLMALLMTTGLLLDGPAIAAETMVGKALGAKSDRRKLFYDGVYSTSVLNLTAALVLSLGLLIFSDQVLELIVPQSTASQALVEETRQYYLWAAFSPLILVGAFQLDGVYIGATRGVALRNSMLAAGLLFVGGIVFVAPILGNHGLWISMSAFMIGRAVFLMLNWRGFEHLLDIPPDARDVSS